MNDIKIEVKEKDDEGNIITAGVLNEREVNYLVQYAINSLMAMGMEFDLKSNPEELEKIRMKVASGMSIN